MQPCSRVVCVGDLHGNMDETRQLWSNLEAHFSKNGDSAALSRATVVFLGDYSDRGPETKAVLDWLLHLRDRRSQEPLSGGTYFLCGNHDWSFASFLGCPPLAPGLTPSAAQLDSTTPQKALASATGYYTHEVQGGMHHQGRRWGGSAIYEADHTFRSYGVHVAGGSGHDWAAVPEERQALRSAVPSSHSDFLASLSWVVDLPVAFPPGRMVCVHAGRHIQVIRLIRRDMTLA